MYFSCKFSFIVLVCFLSNVFSHMDQDFSQTSSDSLEKNENENDNDNELGMDIDNPAVKEKKHGNPKPKRSFQSDENVKPKEKKVTKKRHVSEKQRNDERRKQMEAPAPKRTIPSTTSTTKTTTRSTTTTKPTTPEPERPYPPLSRRYRRIFNAEETAAIEDFPFMAALLMNNRLWCGAAIVSRDKILTAAHCLQLQYNNRFFREYMKMLTVRVGSANTSVGGEVLPVSEIWFHPNYKPQTLEFNLAILTLPKNMSFDKAESPIDSIAYASSHIIASDKKILFLGWGSVLGESGAGGDVLLQKVELPIYDHTDCQEIYGKDLVSKYNFCAGYITLRRNVCNDSRRYLKSCQDHVLENADFHETTGHTNLAREPEHDAGGPAIMDGLLVGILSFSNKRCDELDKPAVFLNIGSMAAWINSVGREPALP